MTFTKKEIEMIKELQRTGNCRPFGLWPEEYQAVFKKVGTRNCFFFTHIANWEKPQNETFNTNTTYVINPDFKPEPEPEFIDIKVQEYQGWLGVFRPEVSDLPYTFMHLHTLPSLPNFRRFFLTNTHYIPIGHVAALIAEGTEVFVKFKKETEK